MSPSHTVLFICSGNTCRSIMAESILKRIGSGRFEAYSAGTHPTGRINPLALEQLTQQGFATAGLRSKSWLEFACETAPPLDFVITLCELAATVPQPAWKGNPVQLTWKFLAAGAVQGTDAEIRQAFSDVYGHINSRLQEFVNQSAERDQSFLLDSKGADRIGCRL